MNVQVACASAYIKIFWSPQDCLWGLPFPGRAMKPESILENSALDKWTQSCRHGTASEKISPTLQEKTSLNSPTIQWSISQKERVVFIHNTPSSTSTYALIAHLYSAWICWVHEKSVRQTAWEGLPAYDDQSESRFASSWEHGTANFKKSHKLFNLQ